MSPSIGFGFAREQAHLPPGGHWKADIATGKAILNLTGGNERMNAAQHLYVLSDSERGEEPFEGPARLHWGSAASADTQFKGYEPNSLLL